MTYEEKYNLKRKKFLLKAIELYNITSNENKLDVNEKNFDIEKTINTPEICAKCGGKCCKHFPCLFSPYDFLDVDNIDYMTSILDTGLICIGQSCYDNNLVLRPRGLKDKPQIVSTRLPLNNQCILYSEAGCMLSSNYRPAEALLYYAKSEDYHIPIYDTYECIEDWSMHQNILKELYNYYKNKKSPILYNPDPNQVLKLTRKIAGYKM